MKELNIGIIGTSGRGRFARAAHRPEEGVRIIAGADIVPANLEEFKECFNEAWTTEDYEEIARSPDINAVFICTPDFLHEEQAVKCLKSGKTVYLEKPMALTVKGCDRILAAAKESGSKLFIGHNMRYFPVVLKMKEIIDSGIIGDIQAVWCRHFVSAGGDYYFKDWHSESKFSNGLLLQKAVHDIDVIHWLAGGYAEIVVGMGKLSVYNRCSKRSPKERGDSRGNLEHWPPLSQTGMSPNIDIEDHSMLLMNLNNGVQVSYSQCHYTPDTFRNYTFIGTEGRLENYGHKGECSVIVYNTRQKSGGTTKPDIVYNLKPFTGGHGGADPRIIDSFIDYIKNDVRPNVSPIAARYAVAAAAMGTKSLRESHAYEPVPELSEELINFFS